MPHTVINAESIIGNHSIINTHVVVKHDNILDGVVHISSFIMLTGDFLVDKETHFIPCFVMILDEKISLDNTIVVSAVVTINISDNFTSVGISVKTKE